MVGKVKDISFRGKRPIFPWSFLPTPHLAASGSCGKPVERPPTESSGSWASRSFKTICTGSFHYHRHYTTMYKHHWTRHAHIFALSLFSGDKKVISDRWDLEKSLTSWLRCFDRSSVATEPSSGGKWGFRSGRKAANMWCMSPLEWDGFWNELFLDSNLCISFEILWYWNQKKNNINRPHLYPFITIQKAHCISEFQWKILYNPSRISGWSFSIKLHATAKFKLQAKLLWDPKRVSNSWKKTSAKKNSSNCPITCMSHVWQMFSLFNKRKRGTNFDLVLKSGTMVVNSLIRMIENDFLGKGSNKQNHGPSCWIIEKPSTRRG